MTPKYRISEEIARWSVETYFRQHADLMWWVAFTNPTAGPWKKIVSKDTTGLNVEIHRFQREEERPDLVLVNDDLRVIVIVEAKDYLEKLITENQMEKSVRVIEEMSRVFLTISHINWGERAKYRIIPSFLWMCKDTAKVLDEDSAARNCYKRFSSAKQPLLNIVVTTDESDNLMPLFILDSKLLENPNQL